MPNARENNYDRIARWYGLLSHLYSLGQIRACKRSQTLAIAPGDRVLYTGAGGGEDALMAARIGAQVTVLDLSPRMVALAGARFREAGLAVELLCGDVLEHGREGWYDVVVSNFFLNVFAEPVMEAVLRHLVRRLRPGGRLLIADFAPCGRNPALNLLRRAYFGLAVLTFRLVAGNALHPLYDYRRLFPGAGLRLEATRGFGLLGLGPAFYWTLAGVRSEDPCFWK
jgi:demethylmenaquinone methyltransferase/2-methoxy-6-polyprenyl-1,4-benzoquinol methylase